MEKKIAAMLEELSGAELRDYADELFRKGDTKALEEFFEYKDSMPVSKASAYMYRHGEIMLNYVYQETLSKYKLLKQASLDHALVTWFYLQELARSKNSDHALFLFWTAEDDAKGIPGLGKDKLLFQAVLNAADLMLKAVCYMEEEKITIRERREAIETTVKVYEHYCEIIKCLSEILGVKEDDEVAGMLDGFFEMAVFKSGRGSSASR